MLGILASFTDPFSKDLFLRFGQGEVRLSRRHGIFLVVDAKNEFRLIRLFRNESGIPSQISDRSPKGVESQVGFPCFLVRSVTLKALVREDGQDIAAEVDLFCSHKRGEEQNPDDSHDGKKTH